MPNVTFNTIVSYLENLATQHTNINSSYRWNVNELTGNLRKGVQLPVMLIDAVETQTTANTSRTIHTHTTAFTILGKPNTRTGNLDAYQAQNDVLQLAQQTCFDIEARIIAESKKALDGNGNKNWLFGMVDVNSFHHFKVGPLFTDGLYGYRTEVAFKNILNNCVSPRHWADI